MGLWTECFLTSERSFPLHKVKNVADEAQEISFVCVSGPWYLGWERKWLPSVSSSANVVGLDSEHHASSAATP